MKSVRELLDEERQVVEYVARRHASAAGDPTTHEIAEHLGVSVKRAREVVCDLIAFEMLVEGPGRRREGVSVGRVPRSLAITPPALRELRALSESKARDDVRQERAQTPEQSRQLYGVLELLRRAHRIVKTVAPISAAAAELDRDMLVYLGQAR